MNFGLDKGQTAADETVTTMSHGHVDALLVAALSKSPTPWPANTNESFESLVEARISDHGIAALIYGNKDNLANWPSGLLDFLRREGIGQAMWEARHRALLSDLLAAMAEIPIQAILLKGTALAYLVYTHASTRKRGDTDLLIAVSDRERARSVLGATGFQPEEAYSLDGDLRLQEVWSHEAADGSRHSIDLHWQVANSPSLEGILRFSDISQDLQTLTTLSPHARAPDRVSLMIHACVHRAGHKVSPYFVDGRQLIEGDRLIWLYDLHLLSGTLSDAEWHNLAGRCRQLGIGPVCYDGLMATRERFETIIPTAVLDALTDGSSKSQAADYLMSKSPLRRAWLDLKAIEGSSARLSYSLARIFPSAAFMRSKYPQHRRWPVALLYALRLASLVVRR